MLSESMERDQWHEMDKGNVKYVCQSIHQKPVTVSSRCRTFTCIHSLYLLIYFANTLNGDANLTKQTYISSSA